MGKFRDFLNESWDLVSSGETTLYRSPTKNGVRKLEKYNSSSGVTSNGFAYSNELYKPASNTLYRISVAGNSWEEVTKSLESVASEAWHEGYHHLVMVEIFDKTQQDWTSKFWKLGFGGTLVFEYVEGSELSHSKFMSPVTKELRIALKIIKKHA